MCRRKYFGFFSLNWQIFWVPSFVPIPGIYALILVEPNGKLENKPWCVVVQYLQDGKSLPSPQPCSSVFHGREGGREARKEAAMVQEANTKEILDQERRKDNKNKGWRVIYWLRWRLQWCNCRCKVKQGNSKKQQENLDMPVCYGARKKQKLKWKLKGGKVVGDDHSRLKLLPERRNGDAWYG